EKFASGASLIDEMTEKSRVLIAEACTHVPLNEDIGRVKIPNLLRKKFGPNIEITNICGNDFPDVEGLKEYDLIIHCGACMFNRRHVLSRIASAEAAGVPITNYGVVMAKMAGILDKIVLP
ncbi:MAG: [Firmicutes bacterium]|nr:[FeFe] hydrogenase H-cluster maturation GTPase HydF [Bacillota bacterium]